ncbi:glycosyltransferase family 2 protein [Neopusillimonas maritima]|jgi:glycosyltransferase involved in cell wall biosynthesis|uniref:Glycosyltransferase n=1 Tax=Neopusillimonas maritima TaxID=2026239 RepID=A0A3A1YTK2_9BURK|nr:glycosyltransferase family 2 protein [Neopusillimonas maritima]RII82814.1 glycosyltransferase [Neopusillimonas maritima]RIY39734.1 glycosyltransferase [Neopusillimonas maritima]|tara:strand:+ start:92675 stop:93664 length:990 start_codon:yes stop_codon:yes gene_type:complete
MSNHKITLKEEDLRAAPLFLSIVVPVFNEATGIDAFHSRLQQTLSQMNGIASEILYIDDGSTDTTPRKLEKIHDQDANVSIARLSRNFGKESALSAGLDLAKGQAVIVIDADLQDPPELIPAMVHAWRQGADVVNMRRITREGESALKKFTSHLFYRVMNRLSDVSIMQDVGDFRLLSRRAVDALTAMPERCRFMKGLYAWIGFHQVILDYHREPRHSGTTKWQYWGLWNYALDGITSFSTGPLKVAMYLGLISALTAFFSGAYFLLKALILGDSVPGFPTLITAILFLGGLQLVAIGIVGEYVGRLYHEVKERPKYILDDVRHEKGAS